MTPKPTALVVEDDDIQRAIVALLLEECEMTVIECDSGEDAAIVLGESGEELAMLFADVHLRSRSKNGVASLAYGDMNGIELARLARQNYPDIHVVVASGDLSLNLPQGATFMPKPLRPLDILREAERSRGL